MAADDTEFSTRVFAAGLALFTVRCPNAAVRDSVEAVFVDLPDGVTADATRDVTDIVIADAADGEVVVGFDEQPAGDPQPLSAALVTLVTNVSLLALDADPEQLHLHCAALARNGKGVLISAESGTGKTMTAAALATRGWTYVSDEAVGAQLGSPAVTGFAKPLMIKPGGSELLPALVSARVRLNEADESYLHVPVTALGAPLATELEPSLIVILHRAADGSTDGSPAGSNLHPADAVVELMEQTMDPGRFGRNAVDVLAQLAAQSTCITLQVGPLDEVADVIEQLVDTPVDTVLPVVLEPVDGANGWRVADDVRSVLIGDRVVVHDTAGGAIAALDEAGTGVWLALHGDPPAWWQPDTMHDPGIVAFLDQLESHRLVARATVDGRTGS